MLLKKRGKRLCPAYSVEFQIQHQVFRFADGLADREAPRSRARERIAAIAAEPLDATRLRRQVLGSLREVIGYDAYVWLLTDPVTAVGAAPLAEVPCLPELPALIKAKYATPVNRWTTLRSQRSPTGRLRDATDPGSSKVDLRQDGRT